MTNIHCLTMEDRGGNTMGKRVSNNNWMGNCNWVSNSMNKWAMNKSRVSNNMSHWVTNNSRSILRNSLIGDILDDSISIVSILDSLDPAVRKSNSVATGGGITISGLSLLEVVSTVVITDTILVSVHWGLSKVWGGIARSSNQGASWGTSSNSYEGSSKNSLHVDCVVLKSY